MLCTQPFVRDPSGKVFKLFDKEMTYRGIPFSCGHCLACRKLRQKKWTLRLILESMCHPQENIRFVTLTYDDDHLIYEIFGHRPILWLHDIQTYIKRLRYYVPELRYFVGAEYGTQTDRPHYHLILYGFPPILDKYVSKLWYRGKANSLGFAYIGHDASDAALQYTAGYVAKKSKTSIFRPKEFREFSLQSRKPALGIPALETIKNAFERCKNYGSPIPSSLTIGRNYPLDRTISNALYRYFYSDMDANEENYLWSLVQRYFSGVVPKFHGFGRLADDLIDESQQRNIQIEKRQKLFHLGSF